MKKYNCKKHKMLIFPTFEEKQHKIILKSIPSELEVVDFHKCMLSLPPVE